MRCPEPEFLAALAEDRLDRHDRDLLLDHAADCDDCRAALLVLRETPVRVRVRSTRRPWIPWAVAAALFIGILGLLALRGRPEERPVPAPERIAELPPKTA